MGSNKNSDKPDISLDSYSLNRPTKNCHGVTIHTPPDKLGEFILNLLSKPQVMKRRFLGSYRIYLNNLLDIHHKIHQCIDYDRQGSLVEFSAEIIFEDNSSIMVNSIEELSTYRFPDNSLPMNCIISWIYLVQFNKESTPEKQSIEIIFQSGEAHIFGTAIGQNRLSS